MAHHPRNVSLGLEIQKRMTSQAREELISMLDAYGLGEFAGSRPSELSGGMRQRAALIRTLALKPDLRPSTNPSPLWTIRPGSPSVTTSAPSSEKTGKPRCW